MGHAQEERPQFVSCAYTEGILVAHRPNMHHLVQQNNRGFEVNYLWQNNDDSPMSKVYRKALQGVQITYRNFGYSEVTGSGFGLSYLLRFPLIQTRKNVCFEFQSQSGFGFITKHYDKINNPKNIAIGSVLNAKTDLELRLTKFLPKFHFGVGLGFSHYSNGAMKNPNLGLNTLFMSFITGYNFAEREITQKLSFRERMDLVDDYADHSLHAELITTVREVPEIPYDAKVYPIIATKLAYIYRPRIKWGWEIGLDFTYNWANPHLYPEDGFTAADAYQLGIYTGAQAYFYNWVVLFGGGYYLVDPVNASGKVYDRLGIQYYFTDKLYTLFTIKANYAKADYFEFGIGYKLKGWAGK